MDNSAMQLNAAFWDNRYESQNTGWDLGTISPPLKDYIDQLDDKSIKVLIPGCGNAYEAEYLLKQGFSSVTVIDISSTLADALKIKLNEYLGTSLTIINDDFFKLDGQFDLILEQTFFCALDPKLRTAYAQKMAKLLTPKGKLTGVLFSREFEKEGPPFGGSRKEYEALFEADFNIKKMADCYNSVKPRQETELFFQLIPKN